jgi:hypothetical protein
MSEQASGPEPTPVLERLEATLRDVGVVSIVHHKFDDEITVFLMRTQGAVERHTAPTLEAAIEAALEAAQ